jgi:hypothetical protein
MRTAYIIYTPQKASPVLDKDFKYADCSYLLFREIGNVLMTEVKKWNVMDAMRGIAVAWESVTSTVIQNLFLPPKYSLGIDEAVKRTWIIRIGKTAGPSFED